ncbi:ribosome recycling factor [Kaistia terrae]|jgi:ribosome recycling factor|uniref:Ribosome-recycling factor n=1 Tax=Kaistia terrae TaxID=537017 RepID=A0ABW0PU86_9HYPH|nr:ribosome recycling factor [Kaistia terrae]MCX5577281.1 ribosome recycling factor [Kaistia terrae]
MNLDDLKRRMDGAISVLRTDLAGLRTGRASSGMLDPIMVNAYGSHMPITQLATISVPEPRLIMVQVWDRATASAVEKAIRESSLGLNPVVEGQVFRIPIPELNTERRMEFVKVAHKYAESARISVRHVRRDGIDGLKKAEKDGSMSEDDSRRMAEKVQKLTDDTIAEIDAILAAKEAEISQI